MIDSTLTPRVDNTLPYSTGPLCTPRHIFPAIRCPANAGSALSVERNGTCFVALQPGIVSLIQQTGHLRQGKMAELDVGSQAPDFTAKTDSGGEISLQSMRGKKVILYFYPKDDTSGCTTEACAFRDHIDAFRATGTEIVGVSKDSWKEHENFKAKYDLPFTLISDADGVVCEAYGVLVLKKHYGREYMGIERSTFLIDPDGVIRRIWRKIRVPGHVDDVLGEVVAEG